MLYVLLCMSFPVGTVKSYKVFLAAHFLFLQRLAEIAHTLLKLIPYDPYTMGCTGLQRSVVGQGVCACVCVCFGDTGC